MRRLQFSFGKGGEDNNSFEFKISVPYQQIDYKCSSVKKQKYVLIGWIWSVAWFANLV